jgi:RNA polymerase sigma-70 factor (ECF subfamily)
MSDLRALVEQIRAGNPSAENEFVMRYARGVKVIVSRGLSDRSAIDDLSQETLTTTLQKIRAGALRDPERVSGFVAAVARNLVIEHGRRLASRAAAVGYGALFHHDTCGSDPLDALLVAEQAALVRHVLEELSQERDRQILSRFYLADETKDQICAALHVTQAHFTRVLFRARERYRDLYRKAVADPPSDIRSTPEASLFLRAL